MLKKKTVTILAGVVTLGIATAATAGGDVYVPPPPTQSDSSWYLGGAVGYGQTHWDNLKGSSSTASGEVKDTTNENYFFHRITSVSDVKNDSCFAWRLFGGFNFNPSLAAQVGYTWLCRPSISSTITTLETSRASAPLPSGPYTPTTTQSDLKIHTYGADLLLRLNIPLGEEGFMLWANGGLGYLHASGNNGFKSRGHFGPAYGLGMSYRFNDNWSLDGQWLRYSGNGEFGADWLTSDYLPHADFYGVGLTYTFS